MGVNDIGELQRQANAIATLDGKIAGRSAPKVWLDPSSGEDGNVFAPVRVGNKVRFFTAGEDYFNDVAQAIKSATKSVFITGWQVNFDVRLTTSERLWDCLKHAVDNGAHVYLMPWMSPKVGLNTHDFETMLAVFQLNAGRDGPPKAHVMPAIQQSDMGSQALGFSHHQKLVVVDNRIAYVGGMDLAYGRRDDSRFSLRMDGREGRERYNSCVPPTYRMSSVEQSAYLTTGELLRHALDPTPDLVTPGARALNSMLESIGVGDLQRYTQRQTDQLREDHVEPLALRAWNAAATAAVRAGNGVIGHLPESTQRRLHQLAATGSASLFSAREAVAAFLLNYSTEGKTPEENRHLQDLLMSLMLVAHAALMHTTDWQPFAMRALASGRRMLPPDGRMLDAERQPRMPWQDVHSRVEGPAVFDLATNFVNRWNSLCRPVADAAQKAQAVLAATGRPELRALGAAMRNVAREGFVAAAHRPMFDAGAKGSCRIQVLRSAPKQLQLDELNARSPDAAVHVRVVEPVRFGRDGRPLNLPERGPVAAPQTNCLDAMVKAIRGAQHFIYIEGQFFQSEHGAVAGIGPELSGPMGSLIDLRSVPGYEDYAKRCNLEAAVNARDMTKIDWQAAVKIPSKDFLEGLARVAKNWGTVQFSLFPFTEAPQGGLLNGIRAELAKRAMKAVRDKLPFHIYMVLPVHPEGTLDNIAVLTQIHWTMQSLVFGEKSLVNSLRRAAKVRDLWQETGFEPEQYARCRHQVEKMPLDELEKVENWRDFLTLLNLRNWDVIGGRPVTEQIYVHSKLLIADDRVAVLGSANLNDRSLTGHRDSELAITVHDETSVRKPITGGPALEVSEVVHNLRVALWKKHFGLTSGVRPATALQGVLDKPGAEATWRAVQARASGNLVAYAATFAFVARNESSLQSDRPASVWPTWRYPARRNADGTPVSTGGRQDGPMPFEERFWDRSAPTVLGTEDLMRVRGYIVALPVEWSRYENNNSGLNLTVLARREGTSPDGQLASTNSSVAAEEGKSPA